MRYEAENKHAFSHKQYFSKHRVLHTDAVLLNVRVSIFILNGTLPTSFRTFILFTFLAIPNFVYT